MDRESALMQVQKFKDAVSSEFPMDRVILFGSHATDKAGDESDIDLILVSPKFRKLNFLERSVRMYDYWSIHQPVDFICYTPEEFKEKNKGVTIVTEAIKKGITV